MVRKGSPTREKYFKDDFTFLTPLQPNTPLWCLFKKTDYELKKKLNYEKAVFYHIGNSLIEFFNR